MRKIMIAGLLVVFVTICLAIISPFFLNTKSYRDGVFQSFKSFTGLEFTAKGDLKVTLFPRPGISIYDVVINNNENGSFKDLLTAQRLDIDFPLSKLISGDISQIDQILIYNGRVNLESFGAGKSNFDFIKDNKTNNFARVILKNSSLSYNYKNSALIENLPGIDAEIEIDQAAHKVMIDGSFRLVDDHLTMKADLDLQDLSNSNIKLTNKVWEFDLSPNGASKADLEFKITNIRSFLANYTNFSQNFISDINTDKSLNIKGSLVFDGQKFSANNIAISAESIISGLINFNANYETNLSMDASIDIDSINLDNLHNESLPVAEKEVKRSNLNNFHLLMPDSLNLLFSNTIKEITFKSKQIKDVSLSGEIFDGNLELYPSTALLPGEMIAEIQGKVINNKVRPAFEGNFKIAGKNFSEMATWLSAIANKEIGTNDIDIVEIKSDISMTPREIDLYNIDFKYGASQILGRMLFEMDKDLPAINGDVSVYNFDFDKYGYLMGLFIGSGPKAQEQDPMSYVRNANFEFDGNFTGADFIAFGQKFANFSSTLSIAQSRISLKNLNMNFADKSYSGELGLDFRSLRPSMKINIKGNLLDDSVVKLDVIQKMFQKPKVTNHNQPDRFAGSKPPENKDATPSDVVSKWSKDRLNLMWLSNLDGSININFDKITALGLNLQNFTWQSQFYNNALVVEDFVSDLFGGKAYAKASLGFNPPSISVTYALDTVQLDAMLNSLIGVSTITGPINVTGSFSMLGNTIFEMLGNVNSTTNFSGKYIEVKNFDLAKVINAVNQAVKKPEDLEAAVTASTTAGAKTMFSDVNGIIESSSGVFSLKNVQLVHKYSNGAVIGSFTLRDFMMKLAATFSFIPARETYSKRQVKYGLAIEGELNKPQITQQLKDIKQYLNFPTAKPAASQ